MQTKDLCVLIHTWTNGEVGAPFNQFRPPVKYFYWPFKGGAPFVDHLYYFCLVLLCFHACLFVDALWSPAGKGLTFFALVCDVVLWRFYFPIGILGQMRWLIVSVSDLCPLSNFTSKMIKMFATMLPCYCMRQSLWCATWPNFEKSEYWPLPHP